jgi:hypothetical protein
MARPSAVYLEPASGVIEKTRPNNHWREVSGAGVLMRTVDRSGEWLAQRVHSSKRFALSEQGWEEVTWPGVSLPAAWTTGQRSQIRFGFCAVTRGEQEALGARRGIAVVLPDIPGRTASAKCPGARYMFQSGMVSEGIPADYLVEKLLSFRLCKMGLSRAAGVWVTTGPMPVLKPTGSQGLSPWEKDALEKLMALASALSDDLAEASRQAFGDTDECSVWSRRRQWQARKASRAGGVSD